MITTIDTQVASTRFAETGTDVHTTCSGSFAPSPVRLRLFADLTR